jgi:hypothetical protein
MKRHPSDSSKFLERASSQQHLFQRGNRHPHESVAPAARTLGTSGKIYSPREAFTNFPAAISAMACDRFNGTMNVNFWSEEFKPKWTFSTKT